MVSRADGMPSDPAIVVVDDDEPTMTFDDWLALIATDDPTNIDADADADAAEVIREIREHDER